jgi:hypothetical protein
MARFANHPARYAPFPIRQPLPLFLNFSSRPAPPRCYDFFMPRIPPRNLDLPSVHPPRPHLPFRVANRSNTKRVGERSEAAFLEKACDFGFGVARPWGDSERYDFILDNGLELLRIQVKGTDSLRAGAYETRATYTIGKGRAVYTRADIDFFIAHVIPLDIWYILPVEVCAPAPMLRFYPHRQAKKMRLEKYREAWRLLEAHHAGDITIHAFAEDATFGAGTPARQPSNPWSRPTPWPMPRLEILFNRR